VRIYIEFSILLAFTVISSEGRDYLQDSERLDAKKGPQPVIGGSRGSKCWKTLDLYE
jgi:hypothetical protein